MQLYLLPWMRKRIKKYIYIYPSGVVFGVVLPTLNPVRILVFEIKTVMLLGYGTVVIIRQWCYNGREF